ncbi:efflux RND transporter permease subunit [Sporosarcina ureilytica]|uniref:Swarming motility protein SwrC n=1 Tax=Sporosarcina ureilytica TaxID=298596 RepID=A0A1D8JEN6_9BACL|nr:efflux RND transporter permease subunit [Sporosarcina ureilytica]AOV07166.1 Swarming motility protein SwrC [Sporosarcina ureilytica]
MKSIVNFVMRNKLAVWLLTIIITVAGLYSGTRMKLETIPDITIPVVSVTTIYPGATPDQVADDISEPLEKAVANVNGVSSVSSTSYQNASSLQVEFTFGTDMEKAESEVEEAIKHIQLPENAMDPNVGRISINAFPVIAVSVSDSDASLEELTKKVEDALVPSIESIEGVASASISGQQIEEISLKFDKEKMASLNLDEETVKMIVKGSDIMMPLGLFQFGDVEQSVVVDGNVTTVEDLKEILIPVMPVGLGGQGDMSTQAQMGSADSMPPVGQNMELPTITLGEIADIKLVGKAESISRTNGKEAIAVQIVKAQQANTVDVVNKVKDEMKQFEKENKNVTITTTLDQGEPIEDSVDTMLNKAIFGALFAVIIIMLFLRNFRSTIISIVSIPMSLLIAVIFLNLMDITLNMMTLGAMTVAIGRVIDDSIVVVENIYRRMHLPGEKLTGRALVREATLQMFIPITSSTLVTVAVFLPIGLVGGMVGELFMPFALTIVFALLASLLVAVTIVPMLAHSLFKKQLYTDTGVLKEQKGKMATAYEKMLNWTLNHKIITSVISIALLVGSLFLVPVIGVSFLPDDEQKMMYVTYTPEPGETLDAVNESVKKAEDYLADLKDVDTIQVSVGGENPMEPGASNGALMFVMFDPNTKEFGKVTEKTIEELQALETQGEFKTQDFGMGGSSNAISYYVYGNHIDEIEPIIGDIEKILNEEPDIKDVKTSLAKSYKEYTLVADQEKLTQYGLTTAQIGMELNPMKQREVLTKITNGNHTIDVFVDVEEKEHKTIDELLQETVQSPLGMEIPISEFVEVKEGTTSDTVSRRNGKIFASVSGTITEKDVTKVSMTIQEEIDKLSLTDGVEINTAGVTEDIAEAFTQLGLAILAAIAIVYLILVITFGGGLAPFAVLFSLPFTVIGALVGLLIAGETISVSSMIGVLMLIGIVVTNAIVLIDRVINMEKQGMSTREAILEAGTTRLRPILMTAIATIGALVPLAIGAEGSGLISKGLGVTVIGGLTSSTLLTLIFVPLVYELFSRFRKKKKAYETD